MLVLVGENACALTKTFSGRSVHPRPRVVGDLAGRQWQGARRALMAAPHDTANVGSRQERVAS